MRTLISGDVPGVFVSKLLLAAVCYALGVWTSGTDAATALNVGNGSDAWLVTVAAIALASIVTGRGVRGSWAFRWLMAARGAFWGAAAFLLGLGTFTPLFLTCFVPAVIFAGVLVGTAFFSRDSYCS